MIIKTVTTRTHPKADQFGKGDTRNENMKRITAKRWRRRFTDKGNKTR